MKRLMTGAAALILTTSFAYAQMPGAVDPNQSGMSNGEASGRSVGLDTETGARTNHGPSRNPIGEGAARDLTPKGESPGVTSAGQAGGR